MRDRSNIQNTTDEIAPKSKKQTRHKLFFAKLTVEDDTELRFSVAERRTTYSTIGDEPVRSKVLAAAAQVLWWPLR